MHQPNLDHPTHDLTLIAAHAAGDLPQSDRPSAEALLAACADCTALHSDLVAIAAASQALPAPISRTRDFQLEPAQAERLRRGSWLRRLLQPFGAAGSSARPIAAAFTSLGVAGLLVATVLPGLIGGGSASAPQSDTAAGAAGAAAATSAPAAARGATTASAPGVPAPQAGGSTQSPADYGANHSSTGAPENTLTADKAGQTSSAIRGPVGIGSLASGAGSSGTGGVSFGVLESTRDAGPNLIFIGSLAFLAIGLALFGLRFAGRRVR
jgi:hypothetical protein